MGFDYLNGEPVAALEGAADPLGPTGGAALYRHDAFQAVGGFDERIFLYYEDLDLALRMRRRGRPLPAWPARRGRCTPTRPSLGAGSGRKYARTGWSRGYMLRRYGVMSQPQLALRALACEGAICAGSAAWGTTRRRGSAGARRGWRDGGGLRAARARRRPAARHLDPRGAAPLRRQDGGARANTGLRVEQAPRYREARPSQRRAREGSPLRGEAAAVVEPAGAGAGLRACPEGRPGRAPVARARGSRRPTRPRGSAAAPGGHELGLGGDADCGRRGGRSVRPAGRCAGLPGGVADVPDDRLGDVGEAPADDPGTAR